MTPTDYPLTIHALPTTEDMGKAAATVAAETLRDAIEQRGYAWLMLADAPSQSARLSGQYFDHVTSLIGRIGDEETGSISVAAGIVADQIVSDRLIHAYRLGGHSILPPQEVLFFPAGERGIDAPNWRFCSAPGGDEANGRFIADFAGRVRSR